MVDGQWNKESREFWRLCPHCGLKHCCEPTDIERKLLNVPAEGQQQRVNAGSEEKRRSRAVAKATTRVASKARKTTKARAPKV